MYVNVSTSESILDIQALFDTSGCNNTTASQALTGKHAQLLVSTADYSIQLITYVGHQKQGLPINGVEYEVELLATSKTYTFYEVDSLLHFVNTYTQNMRKVQAISFSLQNVEKSLYEFEKKNAAERRILHFLPQKISIIDVSERDEQRFNGFIRTEDIANMASLFDLIKAKISNWTPH